MTKVNARLFVAVCSFVSALVFSPIIAQADTVTEMSYQQIVTSENPESEIFLHSLRHLRIRSTAQKFLQEFDQALDAQLADQETGDLFTHPSYVRLLAARQLKEQEEEMLEYALERVGTDRKNASLAKALTTAVQSFDKPLLATDEVDSAILAEIEALVPEIQEQVIEPQFSNHEHETSGTGKKDVHPDSGEAGVISGSEFSENRWALTFDDGPSDEYTHQIVGNLRSNHMHGSFFWLAKNSDHFPDAIALTKSAGMVIGNHSFHHKLLTKASRGQLNEEINHAQSQLTKDLGFAPKFFRCPYGACGRVHSEIRKRIAQLGLISVIWNVDSLDWQDRNPKTVYQRVKKQMAIRKHGIVLFHDIHPQSVAASKLVMGYLAKGVKNKTTRVLTVKQAVAELGSPGGMK